MTDLEASIQGEQILWRGKPQFKCFILETIFSPMLAFALIWTSFDLGAMYFLLADGFLDEFKGFAIVALSLFFLVHMTPVWIYLSRIIFSKLRYKHTEYVITENGIYISGGLFSAKVKSSPFSEISHLTIHRGFFDNKLNLGDINLIRTRLVTDNPSVPPRRISMTINIFDIEDYQQVFELIKSLKSDIYSNPNTTGYSTNYEKDW